MIFKSCFAIFILLNLKNIYVSAQCSNFYNVFAGDICENIAAAFKTSVSGLQQLNPGLNCLNLQVGQRLCVPNVNTNLILPVPIVPTATCTSNFYTIFSGDTCTNIAAAFRTTVANLQQLNPTLNCNNLQQGTRICVPSVNNNVTPYPNPNPSPNPNTCLNFYTIFNGDTCTNIAAAFRTTVTNLQQLNPNLNCNNLQQGTRICVPSVNNNVTPFPNTSPNPNTCTNFYIIASSDTCNTLAAKFFTTAANIQTLNPGLNCLSLPIGTRICVPSISGIVTTASPLNCQNTYTIFSGDTCTNIAAAFRTTITNLQQLNPSLNCNNLQSGLKICVPSVNNIVTPYPNPNPIPFTCTTGTYTVFSGDNCQNIISAYKTTLDVLTQLNPGLNCNNLQVGQKLCVPSVNNNNNNGFIPIVTPSTTTCTNFYTVFSGDSCQNIAGAFKTTIAGLQSLNPSLNCANLQVGSRICVPSVNSNSGGSFIPIVTPCSNFYTVFSGDSCQNIAGAFRTTINNLQVLNPSLNCNNLQIGSKICVPSVLVAAVASSTCTNFYVIQASDSCETIAARYRLSNLALLDLNPGLDCQSIPVGNRLCVPAVNTNVFIPTPSAQCQNYYTIHKDDTCDVVVSTFKTNLYTLYSLNPALNCDNLVYGQSICVPVLSSPASLDKCLSYYTVFQGDICYDIAIKSKITLDQLTLINGPSLDCNNLKIGQQICVGNENLSIMSKSSLCSLYYTVAPGDVCSTIAFSNKISLETFKSLNPAADCNNLRLGQNVCISGPTTKSSKTCSFDYIVQEGDSCYALSVKYGLSLDNLKSSVNCNNLQVGQGICIQNY